MKLLLNGFRVSLQKADLPIQGLVAKEIGLPVSSIKVVRILRESIDARKKFAIALVYNLELDVDAAAGLIQRALKTHSGLQLVQPVVSPVLVKGISPLKARPVIVGAGPAGYFAALTLARNGYRPLLLERGDDVDTRTQKVKEFWQGGVLDTESNVQFGEGGAGTFSDGKLTTRINDARISFVLKTMVENGASEEILYKHKPHVGTDKLRLFVKGLRKQVEEAGGEVRFRAKLTGLCTEQGRLAAVKINETEEIATNVLILAIGHSARDTYSMLEQSGLSMESKAFAIGLRVEHPQSLIDKAQYGETNLHPRLGAADYQLTFQDHETGRGAYAFCMCPGGKVVAATSEKGQVVTNGMSEFARDTGLANSALVVTVNPNDFVIPGPLGGIEFQRRWEKQAYKLGGGDYTAPAQTVQDFKLDVVSSKLELAASYEPGVKTANLRDALPKEVGEVLCRALESFDRKISGFGSAEATLTGVETRTSAPLRILRDESLQSVSLQGLYPAGEGAGYAGGIMSAAVDGIRVAEAVIKQYSPVERRS